MDWSKFARVSKALAGGVAAGLGSSGSVAVAIPTEVGMPWYGYVVVALVNAGLGFLAVYQAPTNKAA